MVHLIVQASKYLMIFLFMIYTFECFHVFRFSYDREKQQIIYAKQRKIMYFIHFDGFLVLFLNTFDVRVLGIYISQVVLIAAIYLVYHLFYKKASELVLNNMCMLLCVSFIMITRISVEKAMKQFAILVFSTVISLVIPLIIKKERSFRKLTWLYVAFGICALGLVFIAGSVSYGAKLSISVAGFSFQASEFVKITYVFFIASMLENDTSPKKLMFTSGIAGLHVLILVASKDLGSAFIFFVAYIMMVYVASKNVWYLVGGFGATFGALYIASILFNHVKQRIVAWQKPLSVIDHEGYQICQSLFAIGTGGLFGLGLCQGKPDKIPVVAQDFIFSAISEEFGGIFALCLIMICVSCFFMFLNISIEMKDQFYQLTALGLGTTYAIQVFLTIGGVTKFIPSTGVTLPLISYGGSSLLSTMIIFGVIQGLYIIQYDRQYPEMEDENTEDAEAMKDIEDIEGDNSNRLKDFDSNDMLYEEPSMDQNEHLGEMRDFTSDNIIDDVANNMANEIKDFTSANVKNYSSDKLDTLSEDDVKSYIGSSVRDFINEDNVKKNSLENHDKKANEQENYDADYLDFLNRIEGDDDLEDYSLDDYSSNDYSSNDNNLEDYSLNDYNPKNYSLNNSSKKTQTIKEGDGHSGKEEYELKDF